MKEHLKESGSIKGEGSHQENDLYNKKRAPYGPRQVVVCFLRVVPAVRVFIKGCFYNVHTAINHIGQVVLGELSPSALLFLIVSLSLALSLSLSLSPSLSLSVVEALWLWSVHAPCPTVLKGTLDARIQVFSVGIIGPKLTMLPIRKILLISKN